MLHIPRECVCCLRYTASNANALCFLLWSLRLYHIFHIISQTLRFSKKKNIICVLGSSLQLLSETFLIIRTIKRGMIRNVRRSACKVLVIRVRFE